MSCGERWSCGRASAVNLQHRIAGGPCLSQSHIKANKMLKPEKWNSGFSSDGKIICFQKTLKRIILGGVDPSIRPQVWEFLLGCYTVASTSDDRKRLRTARRERYEELIKQCQLMHSSIGTGSLAYVVGAKVMDMRAPPKDNGITEQSSVENANNVDEENCYINNGTPLECHGENSSVRESPEGAAYESSSFAAPSSNLNGRRECDGSQYVNESCFDFPALPVTDLFGKGEEGERDGDNTHNGKFLRHKLRFKDEKMHNFQISNNDELIIESNLSRFSASNNVSNSEIEVDRGDVRDPVQHSNNIEKKKEVVNRMRISDVPDTEFIDGMLPQPEAVSTDKVSEWLWTLHRIVVDVVRTDSHLEFYEDTRNLARMSDILAVYAWVDPATGYCQGMSDLLSPFIVLFEDDADAFWCFEMLLRRTRENFQMEGPIGVMKQLQQLSSILELTDKEMFAHLSNIGAESLHFAFRMLLVLFRRELPFHEALSMWEMMWAADFDESMINCLEKNCLETLNVQIKRDGETETRGASVENGKGGDYSMSNNEAGMKSATTHFCGWTTNFWSKEDLTGICTSVSSSNKVDDELPVFCVAAILIINRQKIIRETRSIDDMIKIFNDKILRINAKRCVRTAIKIRKKYFYKVIKKNDSMAGNGE